MWKNIISIKHSNNCKQCVMKIYKNRTSIFKGENIDSELWIDLRNRFFTLKIKYKVKIELLAHHVSHSHWTARWGWSPWNSLSLPLSSPVSTSSPCGTGPRCSRWRSACWRPGSSIPGQCLRGYWTWGLRSCSCPVSPGCAAASPWVGAREVVWTCRSVPYLVWNFLEVLDSRTFVEFRDRRTTGIDELRIKTPQWQSKSNDDLWKRNLSGDVTISILITTEV